jgi:hypothetical protein
MSLISIVFDPDKWTNEGITAAATAAIAVFTIVLVLVTNRQAKLTKQALIVDKRAFVFAAGFNPEWILDATTGHYLWKFRPVWQNSGDTATKGLNFYVDAELRNSTLPPNFNFVEGTVPPGPGMLGPKSSAVAGNAPLLPAAAISPQDIADIIANKKFLYLWGWAKYFDQFPNTPKHQTHFCWQITAAGDPFAFVPGQSPGTSLQFFNIHTAQGNWADKKET